MNKKYKVVLLTWLVFSMAADQYKQRQALKLLLEGVKDQQEVLEILNKEMINKKSVQALFDEVFGQTGVVRGH